MDIGPTMAKLHGGRGQFFSKFSQNRFLTQIWVFGSYFLPLPPAFHPTLGGQIFFQKLVKIDFE